VALNSSQDVVEEVGEADGDYQGGFAHAFLGRDANSSDSIIAISLQLVGGSMGKLSDADLTSS
jgi:hypothetical protein